MPEFAVHVRPIMPSAAALKLMDELDKALHDDLDASGEEVKDYLRQIVGGWSHQVDFRATKRFARNEVRLGFYAVGEGKRIFDWLNLGTKGPYTIPKGGVAAASLLKWFGRYVPRTTPYGMGGYKGLGRHVGPGWVYAREVEHPGIRPRRFHEAVARWHEPKFRARIRRTINRIGMRARRRGLL